MNAEKVEPHDVKFHVGTGTVVCTCGAYFQSQQYGLTMQRNAVSLWAEHVREELRTPLDPTDPTDLRVPPFERVSDIDFSPAGGESDG